jgi:hypothetical protein
MYFRAIYVENCEGSSRLCWRREKAGTGLMSVMAAALAILPSPTPPNILLDLQSDH